MQTSKAESYVNPPSFDFRSGFDVDACALGKVVTYLLSIRRIDFLTPDVPRAITQSTSQRLTDLNFPSQVCLPGLLGLAQGDVDMSGSQRPQTL